MRLKQLYTSFLDFIDGVLPESDKNRRVLLISVLTGILIFAVVWFWSSKPSEEEKIQTLIDILNTGSDMLDRDLAIDKLKSMPRDIVYPALVAALPGDFKTSFWGDDKDISQKLGYSYIAKALIELGPPVHKSLFEAAESKDSNIRFYVAWILGLIQDSSAVPVLSSLMNDPVQKVSFRAFKSILMFPDPPASEIIVDVLKRNKKDKFYTEALKSLCSYREPYIEVFSTLISHPDRKVRREVACLFGLQKDEDALPYLKKLMSDKSASVRRTAAESMFKIDPSYASSVVGKRGLGDSYWKNRLFFVELLCRNGPAKNQRMIKRYLKDKKRVSKSTVDGRGRKVVEIIYPVRSVAYQCLTSAGIDPGRVVVGKLIHKNR